MDTKLVQGRQFHLDRLDLKEFQVPGSTSIEIKFKKKTKLFTEEEGNKHKNSTEDVLMENFLLGKEVF